MQPDELGAQVVEAVKDYVGRLDAAITRRLDAQARMIERIELQIEQIPAGAKGDPGEKGDAGERGEPGEAAPIEPEEDPDVVQLFLTGIMRNTLNEGHTNGSR